MKNWLLIGTIFVSILSGCAKNVYEQKSRFHKDGRAKPVVMLVPVFDRSDAQLGWSLSEEFTDQLRQKLLKSKSFYLNTPEEVNEITHALTEKDTPFDMQPHWVATTFSTSEFVVFSEIVSHDIHPKPSSGSFFNKLSPSSELTFTIRLRVFDLRKRDAEVILEELISQNYAVPPPKGLGEKQDNYWQKLSFSVSPLGIAHSQIVKEISKRIEEYILLAQSRS